MSKSYNIPGLGLVHSYADVKPVEKSAPAPKPVEMPRDYVGTDPFGGDARSTAEVVTKAELKLGDKGAFQENKVSGGALEEKNADGVIEEADRVEDELSEKDAKDVIEEADRVLDDLDEKDDDDVIQEDDRVEGEYPESQDQVLELGKSYVSLGDPVFVPNANLRGTVQRLAVYVKKSEGEESADSVSVTIKGNGRLETYDISEVMPTQ